VRPLVWSAKNSSPDTQESQWMLRSNDLLHFRVEMSECVNDFVLVTSLVPGPSSSPAQQSSPQFHWSWRASHSDCSSLPRSVSVSTSTHPSNSAESPTINVQSTINRCLFLKMVINCKSSIITNTWGTRWWPRLLNGRQRSNDIHRCVLLCRAVQVLPLSCGDNLRWLLCNEH